jgi:hypothetical protein
VVLIVIGEKCNHALSCVIPHLVQNFLVDAGTMVKRYDSEISCQVEAGKASVRIYCLSYFSVIMFAHKKQRRFGVQ